MDSNILSLLDVFSHCHPLFIILSRWKTKIEDNEELLPVLQLFQPGVNFIKTKHNVTKHVVV
jgi:hypothetical protein